MEDEELSPEIEKRIRKYFKRSGIRRMYRLGRTGGSTLMLEFVIRGRVFFTIDLWKRKNGLFKGYK